MKKTVSLLLTILMIVMAMPAAFAAEAAPEPTEIMENVYSLPNNGYLVYGTDKALLIDGQYIVSGWGGEDTSRKVVIDAITGGLPVELVSTAAGSGQAEFDLGGRIIKVVQIPGVNSKAVAYLDATAQLLLTGDNIGSGTVTLMATCGYSNIVGTPEQATYAINAYTAFAQSVAALMELTKDMDQLTIVTAEAILGASYLADINTLITKFLNADHDQRYTYVSEGVNGDHSANWKASYGSASMVVHDPFLGLYGYRLGGTALYPTDENDKFFILDYGTYYTIHDTDVQTCGVIMNDTEALVVDVDYYNPDLFFETLFSLIGDRDLYVYITHGHLDHFKNLQDLDPARVKGLYWPGDDDCSIDLTAYADKMVRLYDGDTFSVAGRDFAVCNITAHSTYGLVLVDKTDRVAFSGDALGTQNYGGDPSVGQLTMDAYEAEIDNLLNNYGPYFDKIQQGHNPYPIDKDWYLGALKTMVSAYRENKDLYVHNGFLTYYINGVLTNDQFYGIFGNVVTDAQWYYSASLGIGSN